MVSSMKNFWSQNSLDCLGSIQEQPVDHVSSRCTGFPQAVETDVRDVHDWEGFVALYATFEAGEPWQTAPQPAGRPRLGWKGQCIPMALCPRGKQNREPNP